MKNPTMAFAGALALLASAVSPSAGQTTNVDLPVTFRFTVSSQGDVTSTDTRATSRIVRSRLTNREILEALGLPPRTRIVARITNDNGEISRSIFAGDQDVTEQLGGLLPLDLITPNLEAFDDPQAFVDNLNGQGILVQMSARGSSSRASAKITQLGVAEAGANLQDTLVFNGLEDVTTTTSVSVNQNTLTGRASWKQSANYTGTGSNEGKPVIVKGTWRSGGRTNLTLEDQSQEQSSE